MDQKNENFSSKEFAKDILPVIELLTHSLPVTASTKSFLASQIKSIKKRHGIL